MIYIDYGYTIKADYPFSLRKHDRNLHWLYGVVDDRTDSILFESRSQPEAEQRYTELLRGIGLKP